MTRQRHRYCHRLLGLIAGVVLAMPPSLAADFDVVIVNGRVIDPETQFDAVCNVGIKDGRIAMITDQVINGTDTIDASGLVVAPGFIDTHVHGQTQFGSKLMLRDGVTTTLDLEVGGINIEKWYAQRKDRWQTNYGISASQELARMTVLDGMVFDHPVDAQQVGPIRAKATLDDGVAGFAVTVADNAELNAIVRRIDEELRQGGLGLASTAGYMSKGLTTREMFEGQKAAARYGRPSASHVRFLGNNRPPTEGTLGFAEAFGNALVLNAPFMAVHDNNRGWWENEEKLAGARAQGHNVWAEYYPYISGSGPIGSEFLKPDTLVEQWGLTYEESMLDPATGEFFTQQSYLARAAEDPGYMVVLFMKQRQPWLPQWLRRPHATVGSDAMPTTDINGNDLTWDDPYSAFVGHPRTAGSHAKVLRLAREHGVPLQQTLSQLSYWSALHLGQAGLESMRRRGRLQQGMVADITVFDPRTVSDRASHKLGEQGLPSTGIPFVLVNGVIVVRDSVVQKVFPGQPIRYPVEAVGRFEPIRAY